MASAVLDTTVLVSALLNPNPGGVSNELLHFAKQAWLTVPRLNRHSLASGSHSIWTLAGWLRPTIGRGLCGGATTGRYAAMRQIERSSGGGRMSRAEGTVQETGFRNSAQGADT